MNKLIFQHINEYNTFRNILVIAHLNFLILYFDSDHRLRVIITIFTPLEFFTSVLADGFLLEFEWQQVSSSLQDSSQYSGRPQQCCRFDSLHPSANFQVLQAL